MIHTSLPVARGGRNGHALRLRPLLRGGFSFTEIMFAVIILGIGFIMVAAIFPVAIQQAKNSSEETNAAGIARGAAGYVGSILSDGGNQTTSTNCPALAVNATTPFGVVQQVQVLAPGGAPAGFVPLFKAIQGNLILPQDPRYGFIVLYRRGWDVGGQATPPTNWSAYAQLYVFPVEARATSTFGPSDLIVPSPPAYADPDSSYVANLMARKVQVVVVKDAATGTSFLAFSTGPAVSVVKQRNVEAAAEGAYVIIANDNITAPAGDIGRMNGLVFKLGVRRADLDGSVGGISPSVVFELQPGSDFTPDPGADGIVGNNDDINAIGISGTSPNQVVVNPTPGSADAYLVGKGYSSAKLDQLGNGTYAAPPTYEAGNMALGYYTTFVKVN